MEKKYNNFPSNSKLNVEPLKKGETAVYRLIGSYDPRTKKHHLRTQLIGSSQVVVDPDNDEVYEAAYISKLKPNGDAMLGDIWLDSGMMCLVTLRHNSAEDQKKYKFMEISNENLSNPFRDVNIQPLFERVKPDSDSIELRGIRTKKREALAVIDGMSDEDIVAFFRSNSLPDAGQPEARRNRIEEIAEQNPDRFLNGAIVAGLGDIALEVENLQRAKVINYDKTQAIWYIHTGKPLLKLTRSFHSDPKMELAKYLIKNQDKLDLLYEEREKIQERHAPKDEEASVPATPKPNPFAKKKPSA